ncbi:MAG: hypothetical protein HYS12_07240 [Planctomycetes bacterium]|nr:hypothetical protein [Planctomycetota bacterium]MBI3461451.1 hypothetical protein [Planctomycetota bacterium]
MATTFRSKNKSLADLAGTILNEEHPMTLRQLFYRCVSRGALQNSQAEYKRLGSVATRLREDEEIPRNWIVDHVRSTLKPSSWSGLADFADTVRHAYRKDFWQQQRHYIEVFVEKDAVAGTIHPITAEYDLPLRVVRGYSSISFAGEIADLWKKITKPIFCYYLGDFDPSGFDLERDLREKLERYADRQAYTRGDWDQHGRHVLGNPDYMQPFVWQRLGVRRTDFKAFDLVALPVKPSDKRSRGFVAKFGDKCAELDALPPTELRDRVRSAIHEHIDWESWQRLERVEQAEQETLNKFVKSLRKKAS